MATPRVSVLVPVHNGAPFLRASIESVLAQSFADFELLVIDDASTDGTREILAEWRDPRIHVVRNEHNLGLTRSLNRALGLARGELVARQDADDVSQPGRFAAQVAFLDRHRDVALVGSWYRKIDAAGKSLGDRKLPTESVDIAWAMLFYCPFVHSSVMFRRREVEADSGYDERFVYAQDYDLWSRLASRHRLANLPRALVDYRQGATTMTSTIGTSSDEVVRIACRNIEAIGGEAPTAALHKAMGRVAIGDTTSLAPNDLAKVRDRVRHLLDAFCRTAPFTSAEVASLRKAVKL